MSTTLQPVTRPSLNPAADLLERAKKALEQYGWTQHRLGSTESGFCASGALLHADGRDTRRRFSDPGSKEFSTARIAFTQAIGRHSIPSWNDRVGRKKEEVL